MGTQEGSFLSGQEVPTETGIDSHCSPSVRRLILVWESDLDGMMPARLKEGPLTGMIPQELGKSLTHAYVLAVRCVRYDFPTLSTAQHRNDCHMGPPLIEPAGFWLGNALHGHYFLTQEIGSIWVWIRHAIPDWGERVTSSGWHPNHGHVISG